MKYAPETQEWVMARHDLIKWVVEAYRSPELLTKQQVIQRFKKTHGRSLRDGTFKTIMMNYLPEEEWRALKALRYSISKTGPANPMTGKTVDQHPGFKGDLRMEEGDPDNPRVYYMRLVPGQGYVRRSHLVMCEMLGIPARSLAPLVVHHIDGDSTRDEPNNLALCTAAGHGAIHGNQLDNQSLQLKRSTLAAAYRSMISP